MLDSTTAPRLFERALNIARELSELSDDLLVREEEFAMLCEEIGGVAADREGIFADPLYPVASVLIWIAARCEAVTDVVPSLEYHFVPLDELADFAGQSA